jgi:hypothetical protein
MGGSKEKDRRREAHHHRRWLRHLSRGLRWLGRVLSLGVERGPESDSGADIIIANTYATNLHIMDAAGLADQHDRANELAVQLAMQARDEWAAENAGSLASGARTYPLIAGSVSAHGPGDEVAKTEGRVPWPSPEQEAANYLRQAELLKGCGVDALFRCALSALKCLPSNVCPQMFALKCSP